MCLAATPFGFTTFFYWAQQTQLHHDSIGYWTASLSTALRSQFEHLDSLCFLYSLSFRNGRAVPKLTALSRMPWISYACRTVHDAIIESSHHDSLSLANLLQRWNMWFSCCWKISKYDRRPSAVLFDMELAPLGGVLFVLLPRPACASVGLNFESC